MTQHGTSKFSSGKWIQVLLNHKICIAASTLVIASLAITATAIGINSSRSAEFAALTQARASTR